MALSDDVSDLLNEVRRLYHRIVEVGETLHADEPVTLGMRGVLEQIERSGPATVPDIARSRSVTRQHIQMLVNALLDEDLVRHEPNPGHKRSSLVALTSSGEKTIRRMRQREARLLDQLDFGMASSRIRAATRTLRNVESTLTDDG